MFLSIITPTLNCEKTLGEALASAGSQMESDIEHLLVDAGSMDGTVEVALSFPWISVTSEPDRGIYDGMNKGATRARGEWLLFLQGDDWLPKGAVAAYRQAIQDHPGCEVVCGSAEAFRDTRKGRQVVWSVVQSRDKELTVRNMALGEPMINARLIRRDVFERLKGFSLDYSLASDRDFLLRAANAGVCQIEIEEMTYCYRWHSESSTMTDGNHLSDKLLSENLRIARQQDITATEDARKALRKWHSGLAVQGALTALEKGGRGFFGFVSTGMLLDRWWLLRLLGEILGCFPAFLMRGCRTRSAVRNSG